MIPIIIFFLYKYICILNLYSFFFEGDYFYYLIFNFRVIYNNLSFIILNFSKFDYIIFINRLLNNIFLLNKVIIIFLNMIFFCSLNNTFMTNSNNKKKFIRQLLLSSTNKLRTPIFINFAIISFRSSIIPF
jgi:hypothetical protein